MGKKALVVDDDKSARSLYMDYFMMSGFDVKGVENGLMALDSLRKEPVDVMVLDLAMPVMSGEDLLETIVKDEQLRRIPILIDTAKGRATGRPKQIAKLYLGKIRYRYLVRPSGIDEIKKAVDELLSGKDPQVPCNYTWAVALTDNQKEKITNRVWAAVQLEEILTCECGPLNAKVSNNPGQGNHMITLSCACGSLMNPTLFDE